MYISYEMNFPQDDEIILQDCDSDNEVDESRNKRRNGEIDDEEEKEDYSLRVLTVSAAKRTNGTSCYNPAVSDLLLLAHPLATLAVR